MIRILSRLPPALRVALFVLIVLGTVVRPLLIVGCEIHAASFAHAAQPHVHDHDGSGSVQDDGHGAHEALQLGSLSAAATPVITFDVPAIRLAAVPIPLPAATPLRTSPAAEPFRPPIG